MIRTEIDHRLATPRISDFITTVVKFQEVRLEGVRQTLSYLW